MYFHVYSFKLQIHAHIYRSFIRHHKMLGVRIAKRKTSLKSRAKANPCGTKLRARIFFGADKFALQTYPAGELRSRGNPAKVSPANIPFLADNRKCCIFFVNAKQKEYPIRQDGVFFLECAAAPENSLPRPARSASNQEVRQGSCEWRQPFVGCREASSSLVARSKNTTRRVVFFSLIRPSPPCQEDTK